jgi:hypothetical protein
MNKCPAFNQTLAILFSGIKMAQTKNYSKTMSNTYGYVGVASTVPDHQPIRLAGKNGTPPTLGVHTAGGD